MTRKALSTEAATLAHVVAFNALAVDSPNATPEQRLEASERMFAAWSALCRRMSELEQLCPNTAATGYEQAQRLRDIAERKVA